MKATCYNNLTPAQKEAYWFGFKHGRMTEKAAQEAARAGRKPTDHGAALEKAVFGTAGTRTGRFSVASPNLSNIPHAVKARKEATRVVLGEGYSHWDYRHDRVWVSLSTDALGIENALRRREVPGERIRIVVEVISAARRTR